MRRNYSLHIKLTEDEKKVWLEKAKKEDTSLSNFVRNCVLDKVVPNPKVKEGKKNIFIEDVEENKRKDNIIMIRVSNAEYLWIKKTSKAAGLSLSEYMRKQAKGEKIVIIHGLKEYSEQLRKIGVNLNQLTYLANNGQIFSVDLEHVKEKLTEMWATLYDFVKAQSG